MLSFPACAKAWRGSWSPLSPWRLAHGSLTSTPCASTKLVLIILLCLVEQQVLGFPGGTQVAFFSTFFASIGNLGRQTKTDLLGLFGLLSGFVYGVVAAFFTSRLPHFPLLLSLVFLGEFLANLAYQKLQRYNIAGLQAGMGLPFAYLATTGPGWGSFAGVRTRIAGIVVAGFTAMVVHAYLWPVLPMRRLRTSIAAALQDTAVSLGRLFDGPRSGWEGSPPSLGETVTRARDLLDDARYLPGPDHADPAYNGILGCLQEIDANLEYVRFLLSLEEEHALRQRFFQVIGDYAEQAQQQPGASGPAIPAVAGPGGPRGIGPLGAGCIRPLGECVPRRRPSPGQGNRSVPTRGDRPLSGPDRAGGREDFRHRPGDQPAQ